MSHWRAYFEKLYPTEITPRELMLPSAVAMADLLSSGIYDGGRLLSIRAGNVQSPKTCVLLVDVEVGLGQRQVQNDIKPIEAMAFVYSRIEALPSVCPLRDDFPVDVPHLNLVWKDYPRTLCLFEMQEEEAIRIATPFILIERTRLWLKETAYGRLHGDDQPLDPIFMNGSKPLVLLRDTTHTGSDLFAACRVSEHSNCPIFIRPATAKDQEDDLRTMLSAVVIVTRPLPQARLRMVPSSVAELVEVYADMHVDLLIQIQAAFQSWITKPGLTKLIDEPCLLVVRTPIERSPGHLGGEATKAFVTECKAGVLAVKIGAFFEAEGYAGPQLGVLARPDLELLRTIKISPMDVHRSFDRSIALAASGLQQEGRDPISVALVGAGALGSQLAVTAARMGLGLWTIIDGDHLLPHNMARHGLSARFMGWAKAEALAEEIQVMLGRGTANGIVETVANSKAQAALSSASLVLDTSASVPVARWLSSEAMHTARTASVFLNPLGTDLVILLEGEGRSPRLDQVEMSYYWALINGDLPGDHLADGRVGLFPSGGCRTPSLAISQADVGSLAPFATKRLLRDPLQKNGLIELRRVSDDGVVLFSSAPMAFSETALGEWTVSVSVSMLREISADRRAAGFLETGGILVGTWDRARKRVYVVGRFDPPPDSVSEKYGFIRGSAGVFQTIEKVEHTTARNLTYIGEWHTHPKGFRSTPSNDDKVLLRWIGHNLRFSDVPPLMLIAGEDGLRVLLGDTGNFAMFGHDQEQAA